MNKETNKVAIIGAGPAGLSMARVLKGLNIPFQVYEKHSNVGGIWDITNQGTPLYESAHFISSKTTSGHMAFPMPAHFPDYPSGTQIFEYIQSFAREYGLYEHVKFNAKVKQINFEDDLWHIEEETGDQASYRWLVCSSGSLWDPNRPKLKGEENFSGEILHAVKYKSSDFFRGKRVLVVGAGNSGVDIACDAAFAAKQAFISMRRGYYFVPKHIFGMPVDVFAKKTGGGSIWLTQWSMGLLLKLLTGDLTRLGLQKPDHPVLSSHPILNSQILHYLQHGDLIAKKDIDYLEENKVYFKDGSFEEIDLIVLATGYKYSIPYLDKSFFEWENNRPKLYLKVFNAQYPTLFANSFIETNSSAYTLFDKMSYVIGKTIESQLKEDKNATEIINTIQQTAPDLSGGIQFVKSDRHTDYVDKDTYIKELKKFGKKWGWEKVEDFLGKYKVQISSEKQAMTVTHG